MDSISPAGEASLSPPVAGAPVVESSESDRPARLPFVVVGIGASAGGLEAYLEFVRDLPAETGMAYVLVQHLSSARESRVAEILSKRSAMPVVEVQDGMALEANRIFVNPSGQVPTLQDGRLRLAAAGSTGKSPVLIDDFFRSLAEEQRERAIAIVMSGMGSDGTIGAQAIKAVGGVCIAQEPESAKFPSMPRKLVDAGFADFVLKPADMPAVLARYSRHPYVQGGDRATQIADDTLAFEEALAVLRHHGQMDFTGYKKATLSRRMARRMSLSETLSLTDYVQHLKHDSAEVAALADDMLIHVSGFFRDPEVWEALRAQAIAPLVAERERDAAIRVWVTACSTGEEAYTLAMLLTEAAEAANKRFQIKVFATDTAERALMHARSGLYASGIESELSAERLARFFDRDDSMYRVKKELRELVVFAEQNVLHDPPFSRLDLCTCRNFLIYLQPEAQQRALGMLHFGLREGGTLLLGLSETVAGSDAIFSTVDKKHRIFRRVGSARQGLVDFVPVRPAANLDGAGPNRSNLAQATQKIVAERFGPPSVVIDREQRVLYFHGATDRYMAPPAGEPTNEILALVRPAYRSALRNAMQQAFTQNATVTVFDAATGPGTKSSRFGLTVAPFDSHTAPTLFLVSFQEAETISGVLAAPRDQRALGGDVADELQRARQELKNLLEETQASREEMRVSNEEVVSINEELQSTNEELETSKEELQSMNEELTTVNLQLQLKLEELEVSTSDLSSLLSSTNIAVIFLDTRYRIRRFTPAARDLMDLLPGDIGRPVRDLARKFSDDDFLSDTAQVLERLAPREKEIRSESGRVYLRRALPYRTGDNRIDGVVLTFIELTEQKKSELALRVSEEQHRLIVEGVRDYAIFMLDRDARIVTWSPGSERLLGYAAWEAIGQPLTLIFTPDDIAGRRLETEMQGATAQGSADEDSWHIRRDGKRFWGTGTLSALRAPDGTLRGFVKVLRDNSQKKMADDALQLAKRAAESANDAKDQFLASVSHELRTPLSAMLLWARLLEEDGYTDPIQVKSGVEVIRSCALQQQELIEDLVDTSRIASGKLVLELEPLDLGVAILHPLNSARISASHKGVVLREQIDSQAGIVSADPKRLGQIVSNLLINAIKFTPKDGIVTFTLRRVGGTVELEVKDTGIGVSKDFLPHIFERFRQGANTTTRVTSGLGLGLTITKQLVEVHGGTITAASDGLGQGSVFTVRLPLAALVTAEPLGIQLTPQEVVADLRGRRILLIEDSSNTRDALAVFLRKAGAYVCDFGSATAAIVDYHEQRPDFIVSDLGMPTMDGHEFIHFIRTWEKERQLPRVPALALTAYADSTNRRKALESGFNQVIAKPIAPEALIQAIGRLAPALS